MKRIKKILTMLCICAFMICAGAVSVFAESSPTFAVEQNTGSAGNIVKVNVNVKNNPGIAAALINITYDEAVLELQSIDNGTVMSGCIYQPPQSMSSPFNI